MINVSNLIILKKEKVLLTKRSYDEDFEAGKWCIPGGTVESKESFEEGLVREILEELGTKIIEFKYFKSYYIENILHARVAYFEGKIDESEINLNNESTEYGWFGIDEIENIELAFNQKNVLNDFFKNKNLNNKIFM